MTLEELERRVALLERLDDIRSQTETVETKSSYRESAKLNALEDILCEIAERLGISRSDFSTHLAVRRNRYLGQYLDMACGVSEPLSAPLDDRSEDEIDTGDVIPPLFPDQ
jgi:DNA-binding transcriptional ArsR family regulator